MKLAFGCDHSAVELKTELMKCAAALGHECVDYGYNPGEITHYPIYAARVCKAVQKKEADMGILLCGTGIGMSITANKFDGIRCALCSDCFSAEATRLHNNSNVLAMGARVIGPELAKRIMTTWLSTGFSNEERHNIRIGMIDGIENGKDPE